MADGSDDTSGAEPTPAALAGLLAAAPAELTDGEVTEGLLDLVELSGRVQAALSRFTASFDARSLPSLDGARSVAGWLAARTELSRPAATGALLMGRGLRDCPVVDAAAGDGRLGAAKVRMLLEARTKVEELFAEQEADLVDEVVPLTVEQARRYLDTWRQVALATAGKDDGPEPGDDPELNGVHLSSTFQRRWRLDGDLDDLTGDALATALDEWIDARIREGVLDPKELKRSQMRAMAIAALVGVGVEAGSPRAQRKADVRITWDAADLFGQPVADLVELAHRRCVTDRGTHLSRFAADEAMCNADVTDVLVHFGLDGTTTVLGTVHTRRHPTDRERLALEERDRGCVFPGCDAPIRWCDAHHTVPYEIGKRTRMDELVLLCAHHHRQAHRGFTVTRSTTGRVRVARPDGTRLDPDPPGEATQADLRHKVPRPTRFAPRLTRAPAAGPPGHPPWTGWFEPDEPYDPAWEAEADALIDTLLDTERNRRHRAA